MAKRSSLRISLQMAIGSLVTLLLIVLGVILTLYSFETQKQSTLAKVSQIFSQTALLTDEKLASMLIPIRTFVEITSELPNLSKGNRHKYQDYLAYMTQFIKAVEGVSAVYVGHDDGSFYMLSKVEKDSEFLSRIKGPDGTAFYLKEITHQNKTIRVNHSFFNAELLLLGQRQDTNSTYDPRQRPWYQGAMTTSATYVTDSYQFHTAGHIGYTIAKQLVGHSGVVGVDISIQKLVTVLREQRHTPSTELLLFREDGLVLLSSDPTVLETRVRKNQTNNNLSLNLAEIKTPALREMYSVFSKGQDLKKTLTLTVNGAKWLGRVQRLPQISNRHDVFIAMLSPFSEIMADARAARIRSIVILGVAICLAIAIGLVFSKRVSMALKDLSDQSAAIRKFKLDTPIAITSAIKEVDELAGNMEIMQSAISRFVEIARALSAEKRMERVLEMILDEAVHVCRADGGGIGLVSDDEGSLTYVLSKNKQIQSHYGGESDRQIDSKPIPLNANNKFVENKVNSNRISYSCPDLRAESLDFSAITSLHQGQNYKCQSVLVIPLLNRQNEMIGILHLVNARSDAGTIQPFSSSKTAYVEALSSNAALALDNNRLLRAQKDLFDSFVRLIASAIDTKSPYTGGHCQRVPVLSSMLAEAASASNDPAFTNFSLSDDEKYELHVASWLHDCGKVTTPEYVVDKATKLETIYNRIHEVRSRFEILWRDAEISYLQDVIATPEFEKNSRKDLENRKQELVADFAFISRCNLGGEVMNSTCRERLATIAKQTWQRHFDDRLGLSDDELTRFSEPAPALPRTETLLADKDFHLFHYLKKEINQPEFCMEKPQLLYNQGELYNLGIAKGTLTTEERYKINDHVVQTINMLSSLPFPKEIRRVPSWAGNHHEKLDGTGYPRCLTGKELSFPERIMAIADIFEALSATDRPYKKPKKLGQCLKIMSFMKKDRHICPDLFNLFLTSGLYLQYAKQHMQTEQIDEVDITEYVSV